LRLKILKKLRTVSLNSEFTGSYKKSVQKKLPLLPTLLQPPPTIRADKPLQQNFRHPHLKNPACLQWTRVRISFLDIVPNDQCT